MPSPPAKGLRHQVAAAGRPRHRDEQTGVTLLQTQISRVAIGGRSRNQAAAEALTGSGPVLEAVGGPDSPLRRPVRGGRGGEQGRDPHLPPLRDKHRGRQEKVCLTRASSGSGPWTSRGVRGTSRCRVPSEAEDCGAGEAAEDAEPCRQRLHRGSSARTSSSSRNGLSPKRSSSCRRSWGGDVGV